MADKERIDEIVKGVVPAIWISLGLVILVCGMFCTLESFFGIGQYKMCAMFCYMFGGILIASGYVWYRVVTK